MDFAEKSSLDLPLPLDTRRDVVALDFKGRQTLP
jgi:hypothetical protein